MCGTSWQENQRVLIVFFGGKIEIDTKLSESLKEPEYNLFVSAKTPLTIASTAGIGGAQGAERPAALRNVVEQWRRKPEPRKAPKK